METVSQRATPRPELGAPTAQTLVAVGMSGGVDSSTAAALLQSEGYSVVGLTMQLWDQRRTAATGATAPREVSGRCCSGNDVYDARRVAEHLEVPYYVVNFEREFEEAVVQPFVAEYLAGRTPVPCTLCNNHVKFDQLLATARQIGAEYLATGHYARVEYDEKRGRYLLKRAADRRKDQSYFLFGLTQEQLSRTLFPLGSLAKEEVRRLARSFGLPVADKPESQEICFVPGGDYARFVEAYSRGEGDAGEEPGEILSSDGRVLGQHDGIHRFTVGQRKGLGIATGTPLYVLGIDPATRRIVVGEDRELQSRSCMVQGVNWIALESPRREMRAAVKIRHQHTPAAGTLYPMEGRVRIEFDEPQRAVTPGQAAVFYDGDIVLGGGWIAQGAA